MIHFSMMSKKKTIPCDKCGARFDHIPKNCPVCGEAIYYRMNAYMRLKLMHIFKQSKAYRWVKIARLFLISTFVLNIIAFLINYVSGMSSWYVFLIPAVFIFLQIIFIWLDKTGWGRNTGVILRSVLPLYLGVFVFSLMEILACLNPDGLMKGMFAGCTPGQVIGYTLWIPTGLGCLASITLTIMANRRIHKNPKSANIGGEIFILNLYTYLPILMMHVVLMVFLYWMLASRWGAKIIFLLELVW